jgi:hypothetical protein
MHPLEYKPSTPKMRYPLSSAIAGLLESVCVAIGAWFWFTDYPRAIWLAVMAACWLVGVVILVHIARKEPRVYLSAVWSCALTLAAISVPLLGSASLYELQEFQRRHLDIADAQWQMKVLQTGMTLYMYYHPGQYPPSLQSLVQLGYVDIRQLRNPLSYYRYLGNRLDSPKNSNDKVLIFEPLNQHSEPGAWICYGDLRVSWVAPEKYEDLMRNQGFASTVSSLPAVVP